jgi:regulator of replication initiation timing
METQVTKPSVKLPEEQLAEIKMLQGKFQDAVLKLGTLQVEKMQLDNAVSDFLAKEKQLKEEWVSLQKLEQGLLDNIVKTYGEGNLNMTDGTFTPR